MDVVCLIHHDQEKLQEILNVTNYVAHKYHIEFGAAKCKVVKIGKGTKSEIKLNNQILEEVTSYKYLGELINNKGNLENHLTATQSKIRAITAQIIAETSNKEFKGTKMKAIWQLVDATIIPILTYTAEGWNYTKEEIEKNTNYLQWSPENNPVPPTRNPNHHSPQWNRIPRDRRYHQEEKNHAGPQTDQYEEKPTN